MSEGKVGREAAAETSSEFTDRLARLQIFTMKLWTATVLKFIELRDRQQFEAGWRARGEADTEKIRRDCGACGGSGWTEPPNHGPDDPYPGDECEYCGRPQLAIKDMPPPGAQPAEEVKP